MVVNPGDAILQTDLDALATLANSKLAPDTDFDFSGDLGTEWQRLRAAVLAEIFSNTDSAIYKSKDALVGREVVGINPSPIADGRLYLGDINTPIPESNYLPLFKNVEFWYAPYKIPPIDVDDPDIRAGDTTVLADGSCPITLMRKLQFVSGNTGIDPLHPNLVVTWTSTVQSGTASDDSPVSRTIYDKPYSASFTQSFSIPQSARAYIIIDIPLVWQGEGDSGDPAKENFTFTADTGQWLWIFVKAPHYFFDDINNPTKIWTLRAFGWVDLDEGDTAINFSVTAAGWWGFGNAANTVMPDDGDAGTIWPETPATARGAQQNGYESSVITLTAQSVVPDAEDAVLIHPGAAGKKIAIAESAADLTQYIANSLRGTEFIEIKPKWLKGVWIANTLPSAATNSFLDMDLPNYLTQIISAGFNIIVEDGAVGRGVSTASASNYLPEPDTGNSNVFLNPSTKVRQPAPYDPNLGAFDLLDGSENGGNPVKLLAAGDTLSGALKYPWWLHLPTPSAYGAPNDIMLLLSESLPIYISIRDGINPDDAGTYDLAITSQTLLTAQLEAQYGTAFHGFYWLIKNATSADKNVVIVRTVYSHEPSIYYAVEPSVANVSAVWPVIRDADAFPWLSHFDPFRMVAQHANADGTINTSFGLNIADYQITTDTANLVLTISVTGKSDLIKADGTVTLAELKEHFGNLAGLSIGWKFTTAEGLTAPGTATERVLKLLPDATLPPEIPVFFPANGWEEIPLHAYNDGVGEPYSVLIGSGNSSKIIPHRGYVIYSILVRRLPVLKVDSTDLNPSIYMPPTDGLDELVVSLGQYIGAKHTSFELIDKGTYTELTTITIPDGELEARVNVFWPVVQGAPLVYRATEAVRVEAMVNWQPVFHSRQNSEGWQRYKEDLWNDEILPSEIFDPSAKYFTDGLRHVNQFDSNTVQFPPSAAAYNDLISVLNLL
jgi:hypothetical protein